MGSGSMVGIAVFSVALLLLSTLATTTVAVVDNCPANCQCAPEAQQADRLKISCRWENIPAFTRPFAQFPFNATKSLLIACSGERPSAFSPDLFANFANLWHLRIEGCVVPTIPTGTFNRLASLRTLHLSHLAAREVAMTLGENIFDGLNRLEKLTITESHVQTVPSRLLCPLQGLQLLNLSRNWLSQASLGFNKDDCAPSVDLVMLDLSRNRINVLRRSDLIALSTVRVMSLAENRLETIDNAVFEDTVNVQHFDLQRNKLRDIRHLPAKLLSLNLAENQLVIVPKAVSVQQHLVSLNLSSNRIDSNTPFLLNSRRLEHLDLSNNAFQKVPSGLIENATNLVSLRLDNNQIDTLDDGAFARLTNLDQLTAGGNKLVKLTKETLVGLDNLTKLDLSGNAISEIANEAFNQLLKLLDLDLSSNTLLEVPFATRKLYSLIRLDLSANKIAKTYKFLFNKLPFLRRLDISRNKLQKVEDYVFADMPRLAVLDLSENSIDHLSADCFAKCPQLADIDLSGNFIVELGAAMTGLSQLRALNLTTNLMTNIDFAQLPVGLTVLSAAQNRIDSVNNGNGDTTQQLRHLDLAVNRITVIPADSLPNSLETINLTRNAIERIENGALASKNRLKWIDLRQNRLTELPEEGLAVDDAAAPVEVYASGNPFVCSCQLDWIKRQRSVRVVAEVVDMEEITCRHAVHGNLLNLATIERTELLCPYKQVCSEDCPCCRFASCDCKNKCPLGCECFHDAPFIVNIVRCSRLEDPDFSPKRIPMYATQIYLDRIRMPVIKSHDFLGRFRLKQLYINHSDVERIEPQAFNELSSLEMLDLSGNRLKTITGEEFHNTPKLRLLFLNDNLLETIADKALTFLPALQSITLHNNRLADLPVAILHVATTLYSITLGHNWFRCDCEKRFLSQQWLPSPQNRQKVFDLDQIYCVENVTAAFRNNDTTVLSAFPPNFGNDIYRIQYSIFEEQANKTLCQPTASGIAGSDDVIIERSDEPNLTIIILAGGLLLLVFLAVIGFIALRRAYSSIDHRRGKYKVPPSLNSSSVGTTSTPVPLISYDAFVTYSKLDEAFVHEEICSPLETEDDYSLCMLYRDLPNSSTPGLHSVEDELINKVERSQCLVLVLTPNFINYEWPSLRIRTVHQWAKEQQKKLIVVLCGDLELTDQLRDLDPELGRFLRFSTQIKRRDLYFWKKIRSSMPSKLSSDDCYASSSTYYSDMYGTITPSKIV